MSDTTFGVKVPEELKEQITKLMQSSGLTGKDFMQGLINVYQVEKTKEQLPEIAQDLKELQGLTQRIDNIYLSIGYRIENITKSQQEQMVQELNKKDSLISDLQAKVSGLGADKDAITEAYNDTINQNKDYLQRVNELADSNNNIKLLIEEYKGKNDMLLGQLKQYEKLPEQLEAAKGLLADAQGRIFETEGNLREKNSDIVRLNEDIKSLKDNQKSEINQLTEKYTQDLERIKEKAEFDKEKVLLDKDRADQLLINKLNQDNNERVKDLLHENQQQNEKISKLMEENQIKSSEINGQDMKIKELIITVENLKELNKVKKQ